MTRNYYSLGNTVNRRLFTRSSQTLSNGTKLLRFSSEVNRRLSAAWDTLCLVYQNTCTFNDWFLAGLSQITYARKRPILTLYLY